MYKGRVEYLIIVVAIWLSILTTVLSEKPYLQQTMLDYMRLSLIKGGDIKDS